MDADVNAGGARARRRAAGAGLWRAVIVVGAGLGLGMAACSSAAWKEGPTDIKLGDNCVREADSGPAARAINYVDPELCGRQVARRSPYHVRITPEPASAPAQGR